MELTDTNLALNEPALLSPPTPDHALVTPSDATPLDQTVLNALSNARDRFLLLRAEAEMERFLADSTMTRLPLTPPYFPPQLNSYQRLLIHRLADTFGIARQVETPTNYQNLALNLPSVVILVKGPDIKLPPVKLAILVPAPVAPATTTATATPPIDSTPSPPPTDSSAQPTPPPVPQFFKILPRSSHPSSSSGSSSVADDDGKGKGRKEMTLEERETAYREARERIFSRENPTPDQVTAGANLPRPNSAGSTYSRSSLAQSMSSHRISPSLTSSSSHVSSPTPFHHNSTVYYTHTQNGAHSAEGFHRGNLRPSAPSFDPGAQSWSAYSYASTSYQNGEYVAQSSYGEGPGIPYPFPHGANPYLQQQQQSDASYDPRFAGGHPGYSTSQPPIQIIAASPLPQHAVYPPSFPVPYPSPFVPPPPPPPQQSHYSPSQQHSQSVPPPFASQLWPRQAPLPSPALSASSAGSYAPSTASSTPDRGGYIMRFAEGGVAYSSGSGPPSRSTGSTGSASTSRTASSSNLRNSSSGYGGGSSPSGPLSAASIGTGGSGIGMGDYERSGGIRRAAGTSTNLSSPAPSSVGGGGGGGGRAMSSSSGSVGNTKRSASASGSSAAGSDSGRILRTSSLAGSAGGGGGGGGDGKGKGRQVEEIPTTSLPNPLHPSLPAKPVWASVLPGATHTNGGAGAGSGGGKNPTTNPNPIYSTASAGAGTTFYPLPPSSQQPHPHPHLHQHEHQPQFPPSQDFNSYPPLSNPIYSLPHGVSTFDRSTGGGNEEIRRPTPRSTALFDPNKSVESSKVDIAPTTMIGKAGEDGGKAGVLGDGLVEGVGGINLHSQ